MALRLHAGSGHNRKMEFPEDLEERECWELLASASLGRIALSVDALPAILPVQYYLAGRSLAICLGQHRIPERSVEGKVVAFAADAIDDVSRSGWTVQAQGVTQLSSIDGGAPRHCGQPDAGQIVHMNPVNMIGHRFNLCPFIADF